jgi:hypothetical protein
MMKYELAKPRKTSCVNLVQRQVAIERIDYNRLHKLSES